MKRLIVNADDFGLTTGVDIGILEAIEAGAVTSTSCLACLNWYPEALPYSLIGKAGIHLQLTDGLPINDPWEIRTLVGREGRFPRTRAGIGPVDLAEVEREWRAQIEVFGRTGVRPTHIDTHHQSHSLPGVDRVYARLAQELGAAGIGMSGGAVKELRAAGVRCADYVETRWNALDRGVSLIELLRADYAAGYETVHLVVHPGYADSALRARSSMVESRPAELAVLLSPEFRRQLGDEGIALVGMSALELPQESVASLDETQ